MPKTLIVGLGNPILGDDGVGWRVAERIRQQMLPDGVEVDMLASGGIGLMERLVGFQNAVVIDALETGRFTVGSVHSFPLEALENPFSGHLGSAHETNLRTALEMGKSLGAVLPISVIVIAIESPYVYEFSEQLSPQVAPAVDAAVQMTLDLIGSMVNQEE